MSPYLRLADLEPGEIDRLLALAAEVEANPVSRALAGKVFGLLMLNPSLRTAASFQAGMAQLGGSTVVVQPGAGSWALEFGDGVRMDGATQEHVRDAVPVLSSYVDGLGVRAFAAGASLEADLQDPVIQAMARLCPKPFVSLESAADHPCQALADWRTLDDHEVPKNGGRFVLCWGWHPRPLPYAVPIAAATMAAKRGMEVTVCAPEGFDLPEGALERVRAAGAEPRVFRDPVEACQGAHALYMKAWASPSAYGDPAGHTERVKGLEGWCAEPGWLAGAAPGAVFMHCLPVRRNAEVADTLIDGSASVTLRQAENRLHVQKALLLALLGGRG